MLTCCEHIFGNCFVQLPLPLPLLPVNELPSNHIEQQSIFNELPSNHIEQQSIFNELPSNHIEQQSIFNELPSNHIEQQINCQVYWPKLLQYFNKRILSFLPYYVCVISLKFHCPITLNMNVYTVNWYKLHWLMTT